MSFNLQQYQHQSLSLNSTVGLILFVQKPLTHILTCIQVRTHATLICFEGHVLSGCCITSHALEPQSWRAHLDATELPSL